MLQNVYHQRIVMQWMYRNEIANSIDDRWCDVVAATRGDVAIPWRYGGQSGSERTRRFWIADQYRAVPSHQPDRHPYMLGRRPIEITQIFNIDDTEYHSKKSAAGPADAPGEVHTLFSGHTALS